MTVTTFASPDTVQKSFEYMALSLTINSVCIRLIVVYRPPKSKPPVSFQCFMQEFSAYLELLSVSSGKVIVVGDYNLHVDNSDDANASKFS